jgi:hypothetical protein
MKAGINAVIAILVNVIVCMHGTVSSTESSFKGIVTYSYENNIPAVNEDLVKYINVSEFLFEIVVFRSS